MVICSPNSLSRKDRDGPIGGSGLIIQKAVRDDDVVFAASFEVGDGNTRPSGLNQPYHDPLPPLAITLASSTNVPGKDDYKGGLGADSPQLHEGAKRKAQEMPILERHNECRRADRSDNGGLCKAPRTELDQKQILSPKCL